MHADRHAAFDPRGLEKRFGALDRLDRRLWLPAIVNTVGHPVARLDALVRVRDRLLAGCAPFSEDDRWPGPGERAAFGGAISRLDLPGIARGSDEVVMQVLRSMLWHLDRIELLAGAMPRDAAVEACALAFADDWVEQAEEFRTVLRVFDGRDANTSLARWSEIRGLLRSQAWDAVEAAHRRVAAMPKLAALLRRLGRARATPAIAPEDTASVTRRDAGPQWIEQRRPTQAPGAAIDTEGIRRSGDLDRILFSEAVLVRRYRRLLAARLAERTLLTYANRQFTVEPELVRRPAQIRSPVTRPRPVMEAGPVILCVDTSASMAGAPEQVAKALVLEAMRAAAAHHRRCRLFAFSGPGDIRQFDLGRGPDALIDAVSFLSSSFHGGTDLSDPLAQALASLEAAAWREADLLIASDGEFGVPQALVRRVREARAHLGLRVQGVLIGDRETIGMRELCDDVFWVRDWRRYGVHGQADTPLYASDLTARYFPGAFERGGGAQ